MLSKAAFFTAHASRQKEQAFRLSRHQDVAAIDFFQRIQTRHRAVEQPQRVIVFF